MSEVKEKTKQPAEPSMKGSFLWGILLFVVLLLVDQLTKFLADAYFSADGAPNEIEIIPGWLAICQHYNKGVAFSGMADAKPWMKILLIIATAAMMAAFAVFYFKLDKRRTLLRVAIVFVVAGGVGNLIDRIYFRMWDADALYGVRDMVDVSAFGFGICNFADFFITGGAVLLVLAFLFFDTDAFFPVGKKYKALAKEAEERRKEKDKAKRKKKKAQAAAKKAAQAPKDGQDNG